MPFGLIALLASLVATGWFVFATDASRQWKILVVAMFLCALACTYVVPRWWLAGLLLQVVLVIGVSLHTKVQR
ncbi:MAG TPA: hypothetical protein VM619_12015 [Luteimonas sp.]|nr:hypothetical protein [Luteimonas sp.]